MVGSFWAPDCCPGRDDVGSAPFLPPKGMPCERETPARARACAQGARAKTLGNLPAPPLRPDLGCDLEQGPCSPEPVFSVIKEGS